MSNALINMVECLISERMGDIINTLAARSDENHFDELMHELELFHSLQKEWRDLVN